MEVEGAREEEGVGPAEEEAEARQPDFLRANRACRDALMDFMADLARSAGGTDEAVDFASELEGCLVGAAALLAGAAGLAAILAAGGGRLAVLDSKDLGAVVGRFAMAREAPRSSASWSTCGLFEGAEAGAGVERVVSVRRARAGAAGGREAMAGRDENALKRESGSERASEARRAVVVRARLELELEVEGWTLAKFAPLACPVGSYIINRLQLCTCTYALQHDRGQAIARTSLHPRLVLVAQLPRHRTATASPPSLLRLAGRIRYRRVSLIASVSHICSAHLAAHSTNRGSVLKHQYPVSTGTDEQYAPHALRHGSSC